MTQFDQIPTPGNQQLPTSGKAIASLVLGIVSIPSCLFYAIPALVCGILAVVFAKGAYEQISMGECNPSSKGLATAGMICGYIGLGLGLLFVVLLIIGLIASFAQA